MHSKKIKKIKITLPLQKFHVVNKNRRLYEEMNWPECLTDPAVAKAYHDMAFDAIAAYTAKDNLSAFFKGVDKDE